MWALETPDIINSYSYTGVVPGTVEIYSESGFNTDGVLLGIAGGVGIATEDFLAVLNNIELDNLGLATRRPVTAYVISNTITRTGFDVDVSDIVNIDAIDQPGLTGDIQTALDEYFLGVEPYILGLSVAVKNDVLSKNTIISIIQQIVAAAGGIFTTATFGETGDLPGGAIDSYNVAGVIRGEKAKLVNLTVNYI